MNGFDRVELGPGACMVRVLNLATEAQRMNVFVGGVLLASAIPYKHNSRYIRMNTGRVVAAAFYAGTRFSPYALTRVNLAGNAFYTLVVTGTRRRPVITLIEDFSAPRGVRVRLSNQAPGSGRALLTQVGGFELRATYGNTTEYEQIRQDAEPLVLRVHDGGSGLRIRVPMREMRAPGNYTVYLTGTQGETPLEALVLRDTN